MSTIAKLDMINSDINHYILLQKNTRNASDRVFFGRCRRTLEAARTRLLSGM